ncbi:hypothetical protein HY416_02800 [Candidatus Kaiserbacteria bacterium]|nr:hypothetical protein [Candidatus Kaiserbacteria bacterium]
MPYPTQAQLLSTGATTLTLTPSFPQPGREFKVRIDAYSYDMTRSRILWSIDGAVKSEYEGEREISLPAPALGVPLSVAVSVTEPSGGVHTAKKTIVPSALDVVVESDTRVPSFYKGRALPSPGSRVRLVAMPSLFSSNGTPAGAGNLLYTWRINKQVAKSGIGQRALATTMPNSGSLLVEVTAETTDGSARHTSATEIAATSPHNLFYEDNPLYGLSHNALPKDFTLLEDEITVRAEPYFVSPDIFRNARHEWTIGNAPVQNPNADPQTLTLRKTGETGSAEVGFSIRNLSSLLQAAAGTFTVHFEN